MNKLLSIMFATALLANCTSLTHAEKTRLQELKSEGITIDHPMSHWERPANPVAAGALNILPGFGNFYLAAGDAGDSSFYLYGFLNLLTWPISVIWGIPEAAIDASTINKRELIFYYDYDRAGKARLAEIMTENRTTPPVVTTK